MRFGANSEAFKRRVSRRFCYSGLVYRERDRQAGMQGSPLFAAVTEAVRICQESLQMYPKIDGEMKKFN